VSNDFCREEGKKRTSAFKSKRDDLIRRLKENDFYVLLKEKSKEHHVKAQEASSMGIRKQKASLSHGANFLGKRKGGESDFLGGARKRFRPRAKARAGFVKRKRKASSSLSCAEGGYSLYRKKKRRRSEPGETPSSGSIKKDNRELGSPVGGELNTSRLKGEKSPHLIRH